MKYNIVLWENRIIKYLKSFFPNIYHKVGFFINTGNVTSSMFYDTAWGYAEIEDKMACDYRLDPGAWSDTQRKDLW